MDDINVNMQRKSFSLPLSAPHSSLSCRICIPRLEKFPAISKFYEQVGERCEKYCGILASKGELDGDICFRLSFRHSIEDGLLTVILSSSLCDKRTGHVIKKGSSTQMWLLSRQRILPCKRRAQVKPKRAKKVT